MTNTLIKTFIKNKEDNPKVLSRQYGYLCGIVGILTNLALAIVKIIIGLASNSIAITADAVNNFSDMGASFVTLFGFYYAGKPADEEHPFGHGRAEYLSALFLSVMVILVGFQFFTTSIQRIKNPVAIDFNGLTIAILIISVFVKIWQGGFYKKIGERIKSQTLRAAYADSMSDVAITGIVIISIIASRFVSFPVDGYIGLIVSLLIIYNGFGIIKDTIDPILGCAPDEDLIEEITSMVNSIEGVVDTHDLIIHNYGAGSIIASIHAEIPDKLSLIEAHEIADYAEREISEKLNINILVHVDPINYDDPEIKDMYDCTKEFLRKIDGNLNIHDFRVIPKKDKELVFDMSVPLEYDDTKIIKIKNAVKVYLKSSFDIKNIYIEVDRGNIIS